MRVHSIMKILLGAALLFGCAVARADNPVISHSYNADPSARVFKGRLYLYPTHDRNDAIGFNTNDYHAYSSDDLKNWTDHGVILSVGQIPWATENGAPYGLWAPDCIEKNGTYYFYFPAPSKKDGPRVGVATSKSPNGPFVAQPDYIKGFSSIDPAVFIDDDGQAYLYWPSDGGCAVAKLTPNMLSLDGPIVQLAGTPNFFEGPSLFKRNGVYYLTYPAFMNGGSGRGGNGQYYDYAMGKSPLGPFEYKGHFTQTEGGGNIHGSAVEYRGKWYFAYHDFSTSVGVPNAGYKRAVRLDELAFNADGTIAPLLWTTSGPPKLKNLDPFERVEAETLAGTDIPSGPHAVTVEACSEGGNDVGSLGNGDWLKYANADFGDGATSIALRAASLSDGNKVELRLDSVHGTVIGTCDVPNTSGWQNWRTVDCEVKFAKGVRDLYLVVVSPETGDRLNLNWWQFAK